MPSADAIIDGLTAIANEWRLLAFGWHAALAALLAMLILGWRPTSPLIAGFLALPLMSVSVLAWWSGNPFNGAVFALLSMILAVTARRLPRDPVRVGPPWAVVPGVLLLAYGWAYPHFLRTDSWTEYAYAAPFGLLPCPTLAVSGGVTLILGLFQSRRWTAVLAVASMVYGVIGVFRLGVALDAGLLAGAVILAVVSVRGARRFETPADLSNHGRAA